MDPLSTARDLVTERCPDAAWALFTGSVVTSCRTAGSDLDIVVVHEAGPGYRESLYFHGRPVELFVHTPQRLAEFPARELADRKPSTHRMLAGGIPLVGDPGELPARCAQAVRPAIW